MSLQAILKINNIDYSAESIAIVKLSTVNISWLFNPQLVAILNDTDLADISFVEQSGFEIRVGTSATNVGETSFVGDIISTGFMISQKRNYNCDSRLFDRGLTYYGQVKVTDISGVDSGWLVFDFKVNALSTVSSVSISPTSPTITDNLQLNYTFNSSTGLSDQSLIRWYKNGSLQHQFNNITTIDASYLGYGDSWLADIIPFDGLEYGTRVTSAVVSVASLPPVASNVRITPLNPNENDILSVDYNFVLSENQDESLIRWYVNDILLTSYNDMRTIRPQVSSGDAVFCVLMPFNGYSYGTALRSETAIIEAADTCVRQIKIDGSLAERDALVISSANPVISWGIIESTGKNIGYTSLKIGISPNDGSVLDTVIETTDNFTYRVANGLLSKGVNYFISIAASDTTEFSNYNVKEFIIKGSRWTSAVSNTTGWTIQLSLHVPFNSTIATDVSNYQYLRIQDGSKFGEVRIYQNRIGFFSSDLTLSPVLTTAHINEMCDIITVSGVGSSVKIFLNNTEIIDATNKLTALTTAKELELAVFGDIAVEYKAIDYTTSGCYYPDVDSAEFNTYGFKEIYNCGENQIIDISSIKGTLQQTDLSGSNSDSSIYRTLFATTPFDDQKDSGVYEIVSGHQEAAIAVVAAKNPINKISMSANGKITAFNYGRGSTIFVNNNIHDWDFAVDFTTVDNEQDADIEIVAENINSNVIQWSSDGLLINTTLTGTVA